MKTILASLTGYESDKAVLSAAIGLAKRFAAHVDCLHVSLDLIAAAPLRGSVPWQDIERDEAGRRARARTEFDAARGQSSLDICDTPVGDGKTASLSWRERTGFDFYETVMQAQSHDLVVVGREAVLGPDRIADLLVNAGKPLLIPAARPGLDGGKVIAIAWKRGPESARAISVAMPLLRTADRVVVLSVPEGKISPEEARTDLSQVCAQLTWHGINAEPIVVHEDQRSAADAIRASAYGCGADMLLMGGYGHSRVREFVLGGVTRALISDFDLPLVIFH